jgi:intraflagellar transport protein 52
LLIIQEGDELPRDFTTMFEINLFKYDFDLVPETVALYKSMSVKHEQLTLIIPQFEVPLLGLAPGVFPPVLRELPNPPLELFDLDD